MANWRSVIKSKFLVSVSLLVLSISLSISPMLQAALFRCSKADGGIEYRDTPCSEDSTLLPIQYSKSDPKTLKTELKTLKKVEKKVSAESRKKTTAQKKEIKSLALNKKRQLRAESSCAKVLKKIEKLEARLRQGANLKKTISIQKQLEKAEALKKRYCSLEKTEKTKDE